MKVLLDTNALLWLLGGSKRLGRSAQHAIEHAAILRVSEMSLLEISVRISAGTLPAQPRLLEAIRNSGMERTGIADAYLDRLELLPLIHRDPFDRLLIAQALTDDLTVVTSDPIFAEYGVRVIDALA